MSGLAITVRMDPPDLVRKYEDFFEGFYKAALQTHQAWVFWVLEYIVKYSRVDTGRSRAAWTPIMDEHGYDYFRSMPPSANEDPISVAQGRSEGSFTDEPFLTTISNNVEYVDDMNQQYGLFGFAPSATGPKKIPGTMVGNVKTKTMRKHEQGIRFEEKITFFEEMGSSTFQRFMDNVKETYEKYGPGGTIPPLVNPVPGAL